MLRFFSDKQLARECLRRKIRYDIEALYTGNGTNRYIGVLSSPDCVNFWQHNLDPPQRDGLTYTEEEFQAELAKQKEIQRKAHERMQGDGEQMHWQPSPVQQAAVELSIPMKENWDGVDDVDPDTLSMTEVQATEQVIDIPAIDETEAIHCFAVGQKVRCVSPLTLVGGEGKSGNDHVLFLGHRYTIIAIVDGGQWVAVAERTGHFHISRFEPEEDEIA